MTRTIDQSYHIIVRYLGQIISEADGDEGRLRASFADTLNLQAIVLAGDEPLAVKIQPQSRPELVAAVEHINSVARGRNPWRQVEFLVKDGQWKMHVTPAN